MRVLQPEQQGVSVNTDSLGAAGRELQQGDGISNPTEAGLAWHMWMQWSLQACQSSPSAACLPTGPRWDEIT